MTTYETESSKIEKAFAAAKKGNPVFFQTEEWEMVCDMAYQQGFKLKGLMYWPYEGVESCDIDGYPEEICIKGNVVTFLYF